MTPAQELQFHLLFDEVLHANPQGLTVAEFHAELERRGFWTEDMKQGVLEEELFRRVSYLLERKVLWTKMNPRQIRRQRQRLKKPPIVRTGVLCDHDGRTLCTVHQDVTGEYLFPENFEDYLPQLFKAYPVPEDYELPQYRDAILDR